MEIGALVIKKEGSLHLLLVVEKFFSILTLGIILFGTTPFQMNVKAMRSMGLPLILTDMVLFSYRYLFDVAAMFQAMQNRLTIFLADKKGWYQSPVSSLWILNR